MRILVYNDQTQTMETWQRDCGEDMPYTRCGHLTVGMFRQGSQSRTLVWSTRRFLRAVDQLAARSPARLKLSRAFERGWSGAQPMIMTHMLGTALSFGSNLSGAGLQRLATMIEDTGLFDYVSGLDQNPNQLHVHQRNEMCSDCVPFAQIRKGSILTEVCVAQDVLWALGYEIPQIHGVFDEPLKRAVCAFQYDRQLKVDGVIGAQTWQALMSTVRMVPGVD